MSTANVAGNVAGVCTTYITNSDTIAIGGSSGSTTATISATHYTYYPTVTTGGTSYPALATTGTTIWTTGATGFNDITLHYGKPNFSDLIEGIRPGDALFKMGAILRLKVGTAFFNKDLSYSMFVDRSMFVYVGVVSDFDGGSERHWFLADTGALVQLCQPIYELAWRGNIRRMFEIEGENGS